jgi:hypothetical protein
MCAAGFRLSTQRFLHVSRPLTVTNVTLHSAAIGITSAGAKPLNGSAEGYAMAEAGRHAEEDSGLRPRTERRRDIHWIADDYARSSSEVASAVAFATSVRKVME